MPLNNPLLWQVLPWLQTLPTSKTSRPIQQESPSEATPSFSDSSGLCGATKPCMVRSGLVFTFHIAGLTPCYHADPAADANTAGSPSDDQARLLQVSQQAATSGAGITRGSFEDTRSAFEIIPESVAIFCMPAKNAGMQARPYISEAGVQTTESHWPSRTHAHAHISHAHISHAHMVQLYGLCHTAGPAQLALHPAASPAASQSLSGSGARRSPGRQTSAQMQLPGPRAAKAGWMKERLARQQLPCWSEVAHSR